MQEPTPEPRQETRPAEPRTPGDTVVIEVPPSVIDPRPIPDNVPLTTIVGEEVGPPTPETGVADVLLGSIALVGALLLASLLLGGLVGAALVYVKHRLGYGGPDRDRAEHVALGIGRREE
jgi:hypothetical protein